MSISAHRKVVTVLFCDEAAGRRDAAIAAWHEALERYERKQIIPLARRVRDRLSSVTETPN